jgi:hypothetical protein
MPRLSKPLTQEALLSLERFKTRHRNGQVPFTGADLTRHFKQENIYATVAAIRKCIQQGMKIGKFTLLRAQGPGTFSVNLVLALHVWTNLSTN